MSDGNRTLKSVLADATRRELLDLLRWDPEIKKGFFDALRQETKNWKWVQDALTDSFSQDSDFKDRVANIIHDKISPNLDLVAANLADNEKFIQKVAEVVAEKVSAKLPPEEELIEKAAQRAVNKLKQELTR